MNRKMFSYPQSIKITKSYCKALTLLSMLLTVYIWITAKPGGYESIWEYLALIVTLPLFPTFCFLFLYSWSDISLSEDGLWVEFVGRDLFVPWSEIVDIRYFGSTKFGSWLIRTRGNRLTIFHRLYSLFYSLSTQPGFLVHPLIESRDVLMREITDHHTCLKK